MKKILFIALLFFGVYVNAQKVKAEVIELDTLTTTERNALTVPAGKVQIVYDETIGDFYVNVKNGGWVTLASLVGGISNLVEDTTPELGGVLDGGGFAISNITALTTTSRVNTEELRFNPDNTIGSTTDFNTFGFKTGNVLYGQKVNSTIELGLDFNALTADKNLVFTDSDITWGGTSLLGGGGGSSPPFDDTTSLVQDPVDGTKEMRIDVGAVSTATTRTLTMPDADVDLGNLGAANLDLTDAFDWTGLHSFSTQLTMENASVRWNNATSTDYWIHNISVASESPTYVYQSFDGGVFNAQYTLNFSGVPANATDLVDKAYVDGLTHTDDQTASEVNITDSGANYDGTTAEAAFIEVADSLAVKITSDITGVTGGTAIKNMYFQTEAGQDTDGTPPAGVASLCIDCSPAKVVATATIAMDGWKMYDDQTADAATITLSDCDPGETLTVYINRASVPTLAGTGLTFNQLPNTTAFASATEMMIVFEVSGLVDGSSNIIIDYYYVER